MRFTRTVLVAAASVTALGLAGCGITDPGKAEPQPTVDPALPTPTNIGPPINNPKDVGAIADPCQLLTPEQAQQLSLSAPPKPGTPSSSGEPGCSWEHLDNTLDLSRNTVQGTGLSSVMKNDNKTVPDGEVDGYPFIEASSTQITCGIFVGTSKTETLSVLTSTDFDSPTPPCEFAKQAAGMVLSNLPPAS